MRRGVRRGLLLWSALMPGTYWTESKEGSLPTKWYFSFSTNATTKDEKRKRNAIFFRIKCSVDILLIFSLAKSAALIYADVTWNARGGGWCAASLIFASIYYTFHCYLHKSTPLQFKFHGLCVCVCFFFWGRLNSDQGCNDLLLGNFQDFDG